MARLALAVVAGVVVLVLAVVFLAAGAGSVSAASLAPGQACTVTGMPASAGARPARGTALDPEQVTNARIIIATARARHLPRQAVLVALITALQESRLHNLDHGDRDSLGLFQQRPSQGWGPPAQLMDPAYAVGKFFDHLTRAPGWQEMSPNAAAQMVQASGTPDAYGPHLPEARGIAAAFAHDPGVHVSCAASAPIGKGVQTVLARARTGLGLPYCWGGGASKGPTKGIPTNGPNPGPNGLSPGCDTGHPGYDCSGLVLFAFAGVGVSLPHSSPGQYTASQGTKVPLTQARAGDLVFTSSDGSVGGIHHVVMVAGPGQVIEAPQDGQTVHIRSWSLRDPGLMPLAVRLPAAGGAA